MPCSKRLNPGRRALPGFQVVEKVHSLSLCSVEKCAFPRGFYSFPGPYNHRIFFALMSLLTRSMKTTPSLLWLFALAVLLSGCNVIQTLTTGVKPSPHDQYVKKLEQSELNTTAMAQAWLEAGNPALHDSVIVTLPFQETGYFASSEPQARFYRFDVKAGQVLTLTSVVKAHPNVRVFADLFLREEESWRRKEHADTSMTLTYEFTEPGSCLVRLQPELLVNAFYSITLSVTPVLLNPVKGASNKSIGSFYGDPRDGGKRKHEGIDIFAPKGTPVVAPTAGIVTRVGQSTLGGKTVWMNDTRRGHSYYFAHLDSQYVKEGMRVKQGDELGTVGNTGNAQYTPSHLHFGVYQRNAIDPLAYIRTMERLVNRLTPDTLFQSVVFRAGKKNASLHAGPSTKLPVYGTVVKDNFVRVIAQSTDWYRVITAEQQEGFIEKKSLVAATSGNKVLLKSPVMLYSEASEASVPMGLVPEQRVESLAVHKNFHYIRTKDGVTGWIVL